MNTNIQEFKPLIKPNQLRDILPITPDIQNFVIQSRQQIQDIIHKKSKKKIFVVGPCSIHDTQQALEYAKKLMVLSNICPNGSSKIVLIFLRLLYISYSYVCLFIPLVF